MTPKDFNNFKGSAKRIEDLDLPRIGHMIGVGEDEIHAVMDVEAASSGFDRQGRPKILFERHWFYRLTSGSKRQQAIQQGLAIKKWSRATYNQDQYKILERAMKIDPVAALQSASWGLGQIMGFNYKKAGYETVEGMVRDFLEDEDKHLEAMINFIRYSGIDDDLRDHNWAGFARVYNGSGYKKNNYDVKLRNAYRKWSRIKDTPWTPGPPKPIEEPQDAELTDVVQVPKSNEKPPVDPSYTLTDLLVMLIRKLFGS